MLTARQLQRTKDGHANGLNFTKRPIFQVFKIRPGRQGHPNVMLTARQLQRIRMVMQMA